MLRLNPQPPRGLFLASIRLFRLKSILPQSILPFLCLANNYSLLSIDPSIKYWLAAAELLKSTTLQFTRVIPGFFMDYWGMPAVRTNLQPFTFGIDISSCQAAIPGDGNDVICMTYTYDMAAFIVRLLDEEDWPEFSVIVGSQTTYNQLLQLAEELRGMSSIVF